MRFICSVALSLSLKCCLFHLISIRVGSYFLSSHTCDYIDISSVVLHALLGSSSGLLLLLLRLDLWRLPFNLTGTCERSVNLSHDLDSDNLRAAKMSRGERFGEKG